MSAYLSGIGAPQVFSPSPTLPHSPRSLPWRNLAGPVTLREGKIKSVFLLLKSHLAAPPRSSSLGAGGGAGGREGSAASGAPPSPSGSIVSWSTAQDTDERNSLGSLRAVRKPSRWEDLYKPVPRPLSFSGLPLSTSSGLLFPLFTLLTSSPSQSPPDQLSVGISFKYRQMTVDEYTQDIISEGEVLT